jgi:glycosyltransferase involved in cell wall biosynthesis
MPSLCITLTSPFVLNAFLLGHIAHLSHSFRVTVCINQRESDVPILLPEGVALKPIEIRRDISPWYDALALARLAGLYRREKFDVVWSITPKAGLLAMLAARIVGTPVRVHFFTGQVWANKKGAARWVLKSFDRVLAASATDLLADSASQRDFLVGNGVVAAGRISVIGNGSVSGVDLQRFRPNPVDRAAIRQSLRIPESAVCLLYVGRMKRDKGVLDLLAAFASLRADHPGLFLALVGPDEEGIVGGVLPEGVRRMGYTQKVESYMAAADIVCLPSYREGFGTVLIEGAAAGLPAVASRIYGIEDAVVDGHTGLLHPPGDADGIRLVIRRLLDDVTMRHQLADNARQRAVRLFAAERVEELFADWIMARMANTPPSAGTRLA